MNVAMIAGQPPDLPPPIQQIYTKLLDGIYCDTSTNQSFTRIALFLAYIDDEIGTTRLQAILRKVDDTMKSKP